MDERHDPRIKSWYVAFRSVSNGHWWQRRFLKPGFQHAFAFTYDAGAHRWVFFDPGWDGITLRVYHPIDFLKKLTKIAPTHTVLLCQRSDERIVFPRAFMTCATEILHLLGINQLSLTPWQLFCALRKRGGKFSFRPELPGA